MTAVRPPTSFPALPTAPSIRSGIPASLPHIAKQNHHRGKDHHRRNPRDSVASNDFVVFPPGRPVPISNLVDPIRSLPAPPQSLGGGSARGHKERPGKGAVSSTWTPAPFGVGPMPGFVYPPSAAGVTRIARHVPRSVAELQVKQAGSRSRADKPARVDVNDWPLPGTYGPGSDSEIIFLRDEPQPQGRRVPSLSAASQQSRTPSLSSGGSSTASSSTLDSALMDQIINGYIAGKSGQAGFKRAGSAAPSIRKALSISAGSGKGQEEIDSKVIEAILADPSLPGLAAQVLNQATGSAVPNITGRFKARGGIHSHTDPKGVEHLDVHFGLDGTFNVNPKDGPAAPRGGPRRRGRARGQRGGFATGGAGSLYGNTGGMY